MSRFIRLFGLDPLPQLSEEDLRYLLRRDSIPIPRRIRYETQPAFEARLTQVNTLFSSEFSHRTHYIEHLARLVKDWSLDPVGVLDEADLRVCLRRNGKSVPLRRWENQVLYRRKLIKVHFYLLNAFQCRKACTNFSQHSQFANHK